MKNFLKSLFFISLFINYSCNSDDEQLTPIQTTTGNFPTSIDFTDYNNSVNNKSINITYNTNNAISQVVLVDNQGTKTKQYSYTNGRISSVTNSGFLSGPDTRTFVYNSSGNLSSIVDETDGSTETFTINYNATTNTYSITDGGDTNSIQLDNTNNPTSYSYSFLTSDVVLTLDESQKGIFEHVSPQIALQFDLALFNNGHLFYSFNQKQINHFAFGVQDFDIVNNRDSEGKISSVVYNFSGGGSQIDITYQSRNL